MNIVGIDYNYDEAWDLPETSAIRVDHKSGTTEIIFSCPDCRMVGLVEQKGNQITIEPCECDF